MTEVQIRAWVRGSDDDARSGLLGWISIGYGELLIDNITLRLTSDHRFTLSFPLRTAKNGQKHAIVRPVDDQARRAIEAEILRQLAQRPDLHAAKEAEDA